MNKNCPYWKIQCLITTFTIFKVLFSIITSDFKGNAAKQRRKLTEEDERKQKNEGQLY